MRISDWSSDVCSSDLNLLGEISSRLPEGEPMFEEDTLTDRPMRFIVAELIREKIFRLVGDELPYGCTVVIEEWEENDTGVRVAACVVVERETHRPILLGTGDRKRVVSGKSVSVRVVLGGRRFLKKKNNIDTSGPPH